MSWDKDWQEREAQRRAKTDALLRMVNGDLDARDVDRSLEVAERRRVKAATPVFSECVIGYRQWRADALDQLWPMTRGTPWVPGVNTAKCAPDPYELYTYNPFVHDRPRRDHRAPHADCGCGLYAWRRMTQFMEPGEEFEHAMPLVMGAVAFWGDVRVHREGFRAEHACVVALAYRETDRPEVRTVLERLAARYRVPLVRFDDLEAEASLSGSPLPESLLPPAPAPYPQAFWGGMQIVTTGGSIKP